MSTSTEGTTAEAAADLKRLQENHPDWNIWRAKTRSGKDGSWMANRRSRVLTTDEMSSGLAHTLGGDTAAELEEQLEKQQNLEQL